MTSPRLCILVVVVGCSSPWPRWRHLPDPSQDGFDAEAGPRSYIVVEWSPLDDTASVDDPTTATPLPLSMGRGVVVEGTLDGAGWNDLAEPVRFGAPDCGSEGSRAPKSPGDYLADVDLFVVQASTSLQLCLELELSEDLFGWDLVLWRLDECGVPVALAMIGEQVLGADEGGVGGGYGWVLEEDTLYAAQLAAYSPTLPDFSVRYRLGLSAIHPNEDGSVGLCPLLPTLGEEDTGLGQTGDDTGLAEREDV